MLRHVSVVNTQSNVELPRRIMPRSCWPKCRVRRHLSIASTPGSLWRSTVSRMPGERERRISRKCAASFVSNAYRRIRGQSGPPLSRNSSFIRAYDIHEMAPGAFHFKSKKSPADRMAFARALLESDASAAAYHTDVSTNRLIAKVTGGAGLHCSRQRLRRSSRHFKFRMASTGPKPLYDRLK
jgi:hypothetical protein